MTDFYKFFYKQKISLRLKEGFFMKIKYNTPENLLKFYNESVEIEQKKKKIEKQGRVIIINQLIRYPLLTLLFGLDIIIFINLKRNDILFYVLNAVIIFYFITLLIYTITFIKNYIVLKKQGINGTLTINKENIIDEDEKFKIELSLKEISSIVVGKYSINILFSNSKIYLRLPIIHKDEIIDTIKKHKNDIQIINLNKS